MPAALFGGLAASMLQTGVNAAESSAQRSMTRELWEAEKKWNSIQEQVKRLRQTGLNPALAATNGMFSPGTTTAPSAPNPIPADFSPVYQGVRDSVELYQQKRLQDAEIESKNANTYAQNIRNQFEFRRQIIELDKLSQDKSLSEAQRNYYAQMRDNAQEEYKWINQKNSAMVQKTVAEGNLAAQQFATEQVRTRIQKLIEKFTPKEQEKILRNFDANYSNLMSAAHKNDKEAAYAAAQKVFQDQETSIRYQMADALVDEAFNQAENSYYEWQQKAKRYSGGTVGEKFPAKWSDEGTNLYPERPSNARRHFKRKNR